MKSFNKNVNLDYCKYTRGQIFKNLIAHILKFHLKETERILSYIQNIL